MSNNLTFPTTVYGYWRPWKSETNYWHDYLDYIRDASLVNYGANTIGKFINQASQEQIEAINIFKRDIGNRINVLSNQLGTISNQINEINQAVLNLNRNLDIQIEQQRLSNLLLKNISELLRIPDSEKERQHSIELGIKFFVNAQKDTDLYDDALEELLKAESMMKQDYFVLHRIGCIYLYVEKHLNPEKALDYFQRAGKYAIVESDPQAIRLINLLNNTQSNIEGIKEIASESYEKAAFAAYILGQFDTAVKLQLKAINLKDSSHNKINLIKYQIRNGEIQEGVKNFGLFLDQSKEIFELVFFDADLFSEKEIQNVINKQLLFIEKEKDLFEMKLNKLSDNGFEVSNIQKDLNNFNALTYKEKYDFIFTYDFDENLGLVLNIGNQVWMHKLLDVDQFRNGDKIKKVNSILEFYIANENKEPAWCYFNFEIGNPIIYNHYAIIDERNICPNGWRLPFKEDFLELIEHSKMTITDTDKYEFNNEHFQLTLNKLFTNESNFGSINSHSQKSLTYIRKANHLDNYKAENLAEQGDFSKQEIYLCGSDSKEENDHFLNFLLITCDYGISKKYKTFFIGADIFKRKIYTNLLAEGQGYIIKCIR